jgi:hypothetical protein
MIHEYDGAYDAPEENHPDPDWDYNPDDENFIAREFQDPGGNSALRRATASNPRVHPCPTCKRPNRLTRKDVNLGYQCDSCADNDERGY